MLWSTWFSLAKTFCLGLSKSRILIQHADIERLRLLLNGRIKVPSFFFVVADGRILYDAKYNPGLGASCFGSNRAASGPYADG